MTDVAYINGTAVSWSDLIWTITLPDLQGAQQRFYGFRKIGFGGEKRERPAVYGQNRSHAPIALPAGKYSPPNPTITWLAHSRDANDTANHTSFLEFLKRAAPDGKSYGNVRMHWLLQVDNPGSRIAYEWFDVYCTGPSADWEETPEGLTRDDEFTCLRHLVNGASLYDSSQEF